MCPSKISILLHSLFALSLSSTPGSFALLIPFLPSPAALHCNLYSSCPTFIHNKPNTRNLSTLQLHAKKSSHQDPNSHSPKGFGSKSSSSSSQPRKASSSSSSSTPLEKTYDIPTPLPIDEQAAMTEFFSAHTEWHPLFASIALHDQVPAHKHLDLPPGKSTPSIEFYENAPWRKLPQVPTGPEKERHMEVISTVLDQFQKALVDIPLSEKLYSRNAEDDNEMHFIEEGRRLLVLDRFQVVEDTGSGGQEQEDLFRICWTEIHHLVSVGRRDTGSLIILNNDDWYSNNDLGKFVDDKIRLPLRFLGLSDYVEVASFVRGKNCVRLIHQLGDIPSLDDRDRDAQGFN